MATRTDLRIGPFATQDDLLGLRQIIPYVSNETASYVPNFYLGDGNPRLQKEYLDKPVDKIAKGYLACHDPETLNMFALVFQADIKNHIEVRLQLFLLQIMTVFKRNMEVQQFRTQAQAGDKNKSGKQTGTPLDPVEAHAGTLPNLIVCPKEEYVESFLGNNTELRPRILAKDTSFYKQANITHKLPRFVNDTDSTIDFHSHELEHFNETFREQSVRLLTFTSTDERATPQSSFHNFLVRLLKKLASIHPKRPVYEQTVLSFYQEIVESYLRQNEDPNFIKRLMFERELDFPAIARLISQRISFELEVLDKFAAIRTKCLALCLVGTQNINEAMKCILVVSTEDGRLGLLSDKSANISKTQEAYTQTALGLPAIGEAAKAIVVADPQLSFLESGLPDQFCSLIHEQLKQAEGKQHIQKIETIAWRVLWWIAKDHYAPSEATQLLYGFLPITPGRVREMMLKTSILKRNVMRCTKDEEVKRLIGELLLTITNRGL